MSTTRAGLIEWAEKQTRDFNQLCQAFVYQACKAFGSAPEVYGSAHLAYEASKIVSTDAASAPLGAIGYWKLGTADHVGISLGGDLWLFGSIHAHAWVGSSSHHIGTSTNAQYQAAAGARWYGWAKTNGKNTISITPDEPKLTATQRKAGATSVNARKAPTTTAAIDAAHSIPAGQVNDFGSTGGYAIGQNVTVGKVTSDVWFVSHGGLFYAAAAFTSQSIAGLTNRTPAPPATKPPVVTPPVVTPPVTTPPVVVTPPVDPPVETSPVDPPTDPTEPTPPVTSPPADPTEPTPPATPAASPWAGILAAIAAFIRGLFTK
jgi:hypothetical protein